MSEPKIIGDIIHNEMKKLSPQETEDFCFLNKEGKSKAIVNAIESGDVILALSLTRIARDMPNEEGGLSDKEILAL